MDKQVNLAGGWNATWNAIAPGNEQAFLIMTVLGVIIVCVAVVVFILQSKRGGGNKPALIVSLIVGGFLSSPQAFFPLVLMFIDLIINTVLRILNIGA
jgi:RsiW-degrading membrane proteinase PrsW (M82 family)